MNWRKQHAHAKGDFGGRRNFVGARKAEFEGERQNEQRQKPAGINELQRPTKTPAAPEGERLRGENRGRNERAARRCDARCRGCFEERYTPRKQKRAQKKRNQVQWKRPRADDGRRGSPLKRRAGRRRSGSWGHEGVTLYLRATLSPMEKNAPAIFNAFARDYDKSRRRFIPEFDQLYGMPAQILALDFPSDTPLRVLDLGAGTGLLSGIVGAAFPRASIVLADAAPQMLEQARERFANDSRFEYLELDFERDELPRPFDAVISSFAIHHLAPEELEPLFKRIFSSLRVGGVFINVDQSLGASPRLANHIEAQWQRDIRAAGALEAEIELALERRSVDRHAPLEYQLNALRQAGFTEVECFYKRFLFAVYAGWKSSDHNV